MERLTVALLEPLSASQPSANVELIKTEASEPMSAARWISENSDADVITQPQTGDTKDKELPMPAAAITQEQDSEVSKISAYKIALAIFAGAGAAKVILNIIPLPSVSSISADKVFVVFIFLMIAAFSVAVIRLLKKYQAIWLNVVVAILAGFGVSFLANLYLLLHYLFVAQSFAEGAVIFAPLESLVPKMNKLGVASAFLAWRLLSGQRWTHASIILWKQLKEATSGKEGTVAKRFDPKLAIGSSFASQAQFYIITIIPAVIIGYVIAKGCQSLFAQIFLFERAKSYIEYPLDVPFTTSPRLIMYNPAITYYHIAGNFFARIHILAGALSAFAVIFTLPKKQKELLLSRDPVGLAIRANCVAICINLVVSAFFFINLLKEKISWDTAKQGMPIYWTQIGIGLGLFFVLKHFFLGIKEVEVDDNDEKRGTGRPEEDDDEEPYLPQKQPIA